MKKNKFYQFLIISLFCPLAAFAKAQEPVKSFKLIESLTLSQAEEVIKADHPELIKKDKKLHIVGRRRSSALDGKTKVLQVVWTGIQNEKNQHAAFDKPLITVVKASQEDLPKDLELPFEGDLKQLDIAYKKLKSGKVGATKEMTAANPESNSRRVNDSGLEEGLGSAGAQGEGPLKTTGKDSDKKEGGETVSRSSGSSTSRNRGGYGSMGANTSGSIPAFQPASSANRNSKNANSSDQDKKTIEVEDCDPRIDDVQGRVYLQTCTVRKTNGSEVSRGQCEDSLKFFDIKKDYNGEGCVDYVNHMEKKAYDRYRKYWVDGRGERHYVGETLYVEDDKPRPFIEEKGNCSAHLDLETMKAHPQVETVYYGRGNARVVVSACHKDLSLSPVSIEETAQGCELLHNFEAKTSTERKRGIYHIGDSEYQAFACRNSGDPLPHEFDISSPCRGVKNMCTKEIMPMGKRFVTLRDGTKHKIGEECEPFGDALGLEFTTEGCEGFKHDIEAGKSYALGKWFYTYKNRPQMVSKCVAGSKVYVHMTETKGYEHDDDAKASYEKQDIWFETEGDDVVVERRKVRYDLPASPYQFKEDRVSQSQLRDLYYDGCYQFTPQDKFKVFTRADNSEYLAFLNTSADKKSANLCQVRQEQKRYREYILDFTDTSHNYYSGHNVPVQYYSKSIISENIDIDLSKIWTTFAMDDVSLTHKSREFQSAYYKIVGDERTSRIYGDLGDSELEDLRPSVEKYIAADGPKVPIFNSGWLSSCCYIYFRQGLKSRSVMVFPNNTEGESEWDLSPDVEWLPYALSSGGRWQRNGSKASYPGSVSDPRNGVLCGPNRVSR